MQTTTCDIIFSGSGIAGLSLLYRAMKSGIWNDKQIVVIDQQLKATNDKTISFWKKQATAFDHIIHSSWDEISFFSNQGEEIKLDAAPYTYHSIRSIDFYRECIDYLEQFPNIRFVQAGIVSIDTEDQHGVVVAGSGKFVAAVVFNSVFMRPELKPGDQYFLQHFKGLLIRTNSPVIPVNKAYLMDYRSAQEHGTTFFYSLPISEKELFVEYTIFSKSVLEQEQYDEKIKEYLTKVLGIKSYSILEEEFGIIPMTDHHFQRQRGSIMNIGSIGGDTRGSTGYTFMNVQKMVDQVIKSYEDHGHPFFREEPLGLKEKLYDATLLHVLDKGNYKGHELFHDLFKGTKAKHVFQFLDAESSLWNDIRIMKSLRTIPFLKAFLKVLKRRLTF